MLDFTTLIPAALAALLGAIAAHQAKQKRMKKEKVPVRVKNQRRK